jgi:hypothetical protein
MKKLAEYFRLGRGKRVRARGAGAGEIMRSQLSKMIRLNQGIISGVLGK